MNKNEAKEWLYKKIQDSGIDINDTGKMIEFLNKLEKENEEEMRVLNKRRWQNNLFIFFINAKYYIGIVLKLPIVILSILFVAIAYLFKFEKAMNIMNKIAFGQLKKEEEDSIFKSYDKFSNHAAIIFYLLLISWFVFKK